MKTNYSMKLFICISNEFEAGFPKEISQTALCGHSNRFSKNLFFLLESLFVQNNYWSNQLSISQINSRNIIPLIDGNIF